MSRPSSKPFITEMNSMPAVIKKPPESARYSALGFPEANAHTDGKLKHPAAVVLFKGLVPHI